VLNRTRLNRNMVTTVQNRTKLNRNMVTREC